MFHILRAFSFSLKTTKITQAGESVKLNFTRMKADANWLFRSFSPLNLVFSLPKYCADYSFIVYILNSTYSITYLA